MNLRYCLLVSTLVTTGVFPSLSLADESEEVKTYGAQCDRGEAGACAHLGLIYDVDPGVAENSETYSPLGGISLFCSSINS